jgi:hypothetical protein
MGEAMTRKRTYKPKQTPSTFEQDLEETFEDMVEEIMPEVISEGLVVLQRDPEIQKLLSSLHLVSEGENIQSIAAQYLPEGMTRKDYARELYRKNGDLYVGKLIHL